MKTRKKRKRKQKQRYEQIQPQRKTKQAAVAFRRDQIDPRQKMSTKLSIMQHANSHHHRHQHHHLDDRLRECRTVLWLLVLCSSHNEHKNPDRQLNGTVFVLLSYLRFHLSSVVSVTVFVVAFALHLAVMAIPKAVECQARQKKRGTQTGGCQDQRNRVCE